jgi:hypothetical protein
MKEKLKRGPFLYGFKTWTVPLGVEIAYVDFRIGKIPHGENRIDFPNFFYEKKDILSLVNNEEEKIKTFDFIKSPILFELSVENLLKLYDDMRLSESDLKILDMFIGMTLFEGSEDSEETFYYIKPYLSFEKSTVKREIAKIILKLGFDGWIALEDSLFYLDSIFLHEDSSKNELQNKTLCVYKSEIMLSAWKNWLRVIF